MADLQQARTAKESLRRELADRGDVRGIGIAPVRGGYGLQVNVESDGTGVPRRVDGVDVRVRVVGGVHAQA